MPQKKPLVGRSTRHVDGIKEMIDIVRHQQAPVLQTMSGSDLALRRRAPLPGILSSGGSDASPRSEAPDAPWRRGGVSGSVDADATPNDLDYDSDDGYDPELMLRRRTPSPLPRNSSALSSKSSHGLDLSRSLDASILSSKMGAVHQARRLSFHDLDHPATKRSVRTLPPVQPSITERSRPTAPVPQLDLSKIIASNPDDDDDDAEPTAHSPDPSSPRTDEFLFGDEIENGSLFDSR